MVGGDDAVRAVGGVQVVADQAAQGRAVAGADGGGVGRRGGAGAVAARGGLFAQAAGGEAVQEGCRRGDVDGEERGGRGDGDVRAGHQAQQMPGLPVARHRAGPHRRVPGPDGRRVRGGGTGAGRRAGAAGRAWAWAMVCLLGGASAGRAGHSSVNRASGGMNIESVSVTPNAR